VRWKRVKSNLVYFGGIKTDEMEACTISLRAGGKGNQVKPDVNLA
jgi:hypothetical protein